MKTNTWRFALLSVFVLLITAQTAFYLLKLRSCNDPDKPTPPACDRLLEAYQQATDAHLQTILALMVGGGAIAAGTAAVTGQKGHPPEPPPEGPAPGGPPRREKPSDDGDTGGLF
jgi:hypothetical protein